MGRKVMPTQTSKDISPQVVHIQTESASSSELLDIKTINVQAGSDLHLTLLATPVGLHMVVGEDRKDILAYGRAVWNAAQMQARRSGDVKEVDSATKLLRLKTALRKLLPTAEFRSKIIRPVAGKEHQNYVIELHLPVPVDSGTKPEEALEKYFDTVERQRGKTASSKCTKPVTSQKDLPTLR